MSAKAVKRVRVGLIGAGSIGRAHAAAIVKAGGDLVAIADANAAAAQALAGQHKVPTAVSDYRQLLKQADIDAVSIALPNYLHAPVALAALAAGKHVLCEKPMAMNVAECKRINAAAARAKRVFQVGLHHRHVAECRAAKDMIVAGKLGKVYHAMVHAVRRRGVPGRGGWFTTRAKAGGGPMADIGVHMLDLTLWLMGHPRPVAVSAQTYRKFIHRDDYTCTGMWSAPVPGGPTDVEDYIVALIRFAGGATVTLECCWAANVTANLWQTQVLGDKAGVMVKPNDSLTIAGQDGMLLTDTVPQIVKSEPFPSEFAGFLAACRAGKGPAAPSANGAQGQYIQAVIDAVYKSARAGKEVRINPADVPKIA